MGKGRAPCCDKSKVKKGPWSAAEDSLLTAFIHKHGHPNWRALPKLAGLLRCGKSCRLRWINYLRPDVKRGNFTPQEQLTIINLHNSLGNKWSKIASYLPGRTDNEIKNVWNTHLKKRLSNNIITAEPKHYYSPSPSTSNHPRRPVQESDPKHNSTSDSPTSSDCPQIQNRPNKALEIPLIMNLAQDDGNFEIPVDLDIDFWDLFGSLQDKDRPHSAKTDEINERDRSTKLEWLGLLEDELGLTSDGVDPLEQAVEMGPGFDYFPIWPSSPQFLGINSILGQ